MSLPTSRKRAAPARWALIPCNKKRRPSIAGASYTTTVEEPKLPPWASLDGDLVRLIAGRVLAGDLTDYIRLRAVCNHWRSSTACPRGRGVVDPRYHPRHWMMLPEGYVLYPGHTRLRGRVRFFNLRTGAFASVHLPIFKDHFAMDSVDGLLLLQRDHDMAIRLFHPFTGDIVDLPSLATLLPQVKALFAPIDRFFTTEVQLLGFIRNVCTAVSFSPDGVVTAMLALTTATVPRVAFATSKDQQWTLSSWETAKPRSQILSFQGKLYFLTVRSEVWMLDPPQLVGSRLASSSLPPPKLIGTCSRDKIRPPLRIAVCDSEILLVARAQFAGSDIRIYRLADVILGRTIPLKSIGDNSIFILRRSMCVSSKAHPSIAANAVVSLHPSLVYLGQYHLSSGTWSIATDGDFHNGPVPSPYTLIHHLYTCCDRSFWNKGQMFCSGQCSKWGVKNKWRAEG